MSGIEVAAITYAILLAGCWLGIRWQAAHERRVARDGSRRC